MATINKKAVQATADGAPIARETWNNITGTVTVFVKVFENGKASTSISIGTKNEKDEWENFYLPVLFSKKCAITLEEGKNKINIKNAFLTVRTSIKDDVKTNGIALMITDAVRL